MGASGDLGRLARWWRDHGPQRPRSIAWITNPTDPDDARTRVDRAVDSGATLLVVHAQGDPIAARAVIAEVTKSNPAQVCDQREGMSDLAWMREVAAIRDGRVGEGPHVLDAAIEAVAAALETARHRRTPVLFDGLVAHAAALVVPDFDPSWLPATSSTDPAVSLAQDHRRVRPAADLHLEADDDLGLRAVLALLDVLETD